MGQDGSVIIDGEDLHTVGEGFEVEFLEEGSFGGFDFLSNGAHLEFFGDFNLSLDDFGGDVEGVEEVDLGGVETGGSWRDGEIYGGNSSDSGFGGNFVGFNLSLEVVDGGFSEDEGDFLLEEGSEDFKFWDFSSILLFKMFEFIFIDAFSSHFDDFSDEGLGYEGVTFLEMTRTLLDARRLLRMSWIWLELTLVKVVRITCL